MPSKSREPLNPTFDEALASIAELVESFRTYADHYRSPGYNEADVRKAFIDKFLIAFGWDVNHDVQQNPYQQEVRVERAVDTVTATGQRRADYALSLAPHFETPVLYVEAKKPGDDIATPDNCFQTIRYANQLGHPIGVLTSFEQLLILDCRYQADIDTAVHRVLQQFQYTEYREREKLAHIFWLISRPAVCEGAIERYADTLPKSPTKKTRAPLYSAPYKRIDEHLLETLDRVRERLAKSLKRRNSDLDSPALTELTQRILDRLVFIRFLEDKLIEPAPWIPKFGKRPGHSAWEDFIASSRRLDRLYNGIVFKFHELLDTPQRLVVDDKAFEEALAVFDYHQSPYLFNAIPLHILGSIYERFLGNGIVVKGKQADLQRKPELRKARGVIYTPKYVVDYVVQNTVGRLIAGKGPGQIAKMRFADIACGSGSFLLGVYDCLLKHVATWYREREGRAPKGTLVKRNGVWCLSLREKARILTSSIYGVDIDPQAVEVAQLSLYLKLLEDETTGSARQYKLDFHAPLLPSLSDNVKCGNSLVSSDYSLLPSERMAVKAFDWREEFPGVMAGKGFDAIVGNPPYIRVSKVDPAQRPYLYAHYQLTHRFDIYVAFVQRAFQLLKPAGKLGFILPNKFVTTDYGAGLRGFLASKQAVERIVDFKDAQVFRDATTYTCLLFLSKSPQPACEYVAAQPHEVRGIQEEPPLRRALSKLGSQPWAFASQRQTDLLEKFQAFPNLGTFCDIQHGLQTGCDHVFLLELVGDDAGAVLHFQPTEGGEPVPLERGAVRRVVKGASDVRRYYIGNARRFVLFPYRTVDGKCRALGLDQIRDEFPLAFQYLSRYKKYLQDRKGKNWWLFRRRNYDLLDGVARLLVPSIAQQTSFALDAQGGYHFLGSGGGGGGGYGLNLKPGATVSLSFLLGVLNSRLLDWLVKLSNSRFHGDYFSFNRQYIEPLPIRPIDFTNKADARLYAGIASAAEELSRLCGQAALASTEHAQTLLVREIETLDRQVNEFVYTLYGLTDEEQRIVEPERTKRK